jgi:hypothetical protein
VTNDYRQQQFLNFYFRVIDFEFTTKCVISIIDLIEYENMTFRTIELNIYDQVVALLLETQ